MDYDVLSNVLSHLSVSEQSKAINELNIGLDKDARTKLRNKRINPTEYFKKLTNDPSLLLDCMTVCGVVLSGSRAADFMYPGCSTDSSDWDFYCEKGSVFPIIFIRYLISIGVIWKNEETDYVCNSERTTYNYSLRVFVGTLKRFDENITINFMLTPSNVFTEILNFDLSISQCVITGYSLMSFYHNSSSKAETLFWHNNRELLTSSIKRVSKYKQRGINPISYEDYFKKGYVNNEQHFDFINKFIRNRTINDDECIHIPFYSLTKTRLDKSKIEELFCITNSLTWEERPYALDRVVYFIMQSLNIPTRDLFNSDSKYTCPILEWYNAAFADIDMIDKEIKRGISKNRIIYERSKSYSDRIFTELYVDLVTCIVAPH